ncbi:tumor necrosis factor ligand superfamily member 10-like [Physella acuta]|uniref:tumor necrosis factor ligand superfamily member 10-like n=1 Tax=Physella acuta TaxID=109671 RepID=UPI0027DB2787|nr:tumor necrosis factor ligand superfamily member 10-like [Physella acuta]XP_059156119.1 tumor necrosis factor ligand superfamily member 10-like [Physella acuta]
MSNTYDPNIDSKEPFIQKNFNSAGSSSTAFNPNANANNGNNNLHSNSVANGHTKNNMEIEYQNLLSTVAKLRTWLFAITGVAIAGFVILIIVVTCLYATLNYELAHHNHKPKIGEQISSMLEREELCLPCNDFRLGPSQQEKDMLTRFTQKDTETGLSCCVDTPMELIDLLKLYIEKKFRSEAAKGLVNIWPRSNSSEPKVAAHLMMTSQDLSQVSQIYGRQYTIQKWEHNQDLSFTTNVNYRHGRLVIPEDGYYYVYSQISFMELYSAHESDGSGRGGSEYPSLSHYIYRYNILYDQGGEEKLIQNSITKCWGQSKTFGEYTSNLGAVLQLRNSDEIFVKVSNLSLVSIDSKMSFFGLFKI